MKIVLRTIKNDNRIIIGFALSGQLDDWNKKFAQAYQSGIANIERKLKTIILRLDEKATGVVVTPDPDEIEAITRVLREGEENSDRLLVKIIKKSISFTSRQWL